MTATVKNRVGLTVPPSVQHQAGFKTGDVVEFKVSGGVITIVPKRPGADDEYTPEQRRGKNWENWGGKTGDSNELSNSVKSYPTRSETG